MYINFKNSTVYIYIYIDYSKIYKDIKTFLKNVSKKMSTKKKCHKTYDAADGNIITAAVNLNGKQRNNLN